MEHSPSWRARGSSASQEIPHILCNPNVPYCIHKWPPRVVILIHRNPFHTPPSHFLKIHLNITLPSTSKFSKWSPSLRISHQNPVGTSPISNACHMPCPSNSSLNHLNLIWAGLQIINLLIMQCPFPSYLIPLILNYLLQHPILEHPQPMLLPQCERHVSHPYRTLGKTILLYVLIFMLFNNTKTKILHLMTASIPCLWTAPNFFNKEILILSHQGLTLGKGGTLDLFWGLAPLFLNCHWPPGPLNSG